MLCSSSSVCFFGFSNTDIYSVSVQLFVVIKFDVIWLITFSPLSLSMKYLPTARVQLVGVVSKWYDRASFTDSLIYSFMVYLFFRQKIIPKIVEQKYIAAIDHSH